MTRFLTLLTLALAMPAAAQEPAPYLTREQALTLPRNEIAEIVFRQLATRMQGMSRPNFTGVFPGPAPAGLDSLVFATRPRATHVAGLCEATRIEVEFHDGDGEGARRATDLSTRSVYKVIGDLELGGERSEEEQRRLEAACARAGPVIADGTGDFGTLTFFAFRGDHHPSAALTALQRAIGGARAGIYRDVACEPTNCAEILGQLGALDLSRLVEVNVERLEQGDARYRIEARFLIEGGANYEISWRVSLEVSGLDAARMMLGRASISQGHTVIE